MKIKSILIMASVVSVSRLIWAQCPEICDGFNTALGQSALVNNTAVANTAVGFQALQNNTVGPANTAVGYNALENNLSGGSNMAIGHGALESNTYGGGNTASGVVALEMNTSGESNTATGVSALNATLRVTTTAPSVVLRSLPILPEQTTPAAVIAVSTIILLAG
jgi:hypothetical protein